MNALNEGLPDSIVHFYFIVFQTKHNYPPAKNTIRAGNPA